MRHHKFAQNTKCPGPAFVLLMWAQDSWAEIVDKEIRSAPVRKSSKNIIFVERMHPLICISFQRSNLCFEDQWNVINQI